MFISNLINNIRCKSSKGWGWVGGKICWDHVLCSNVSWHLERRRRNPWTCMHELAGSEDSSQLFIMIIYLFMTSCIIHMSKQTLIGIWNMNRQNDKNEEQKIGYRGLTAINNQVMLDHLCCLIAHINKEN